MRTNRILPLISASVFALLPPLPSYGHCVLLHDGEYVEAAVRSGDFERAVPLLDQLIAKNPADANAHRCRAFALLLTGKANVAVKEFTSAIALKPTDPVLFYGRGTARGLLRNFAEAISDLDEAIRLDPEYWPAYASRGDFLSELGSYEKAADDWLRCLSVPNLQDSSQRTPPRHKRDRMYPDLARAKRLDLRSIVDFLCWQHVYKSFHWSRRLNPLGMFTPDKLRDAQEHRLAAAIRAMDGKLDEAIACAEKAAVLAPWNPETYRLRACIRVFQREWRHAVADLNKVIEIEPGDRETLQIRSQLHLHLGHRHEYEADQERLRRLSEDLVERVDEKLDAMKRTLEQLEQLKERK